MTAELATNDRVSPKPRRVATGRVPFFGWVSGLIVPLGVAILWEIVARNRLLSSSLFPALSSVATVWLDWTFGANGKALVYSGTWLQHVMASAQRVLLGFALGSSAGVMLGVLTGWSRFSRALLDPLVQWLRPIPVTAWVPLSIIWFGIGGAPAVGLVFIGAFFPTYVNSMYGVMQVEDKLIRAARMLGAQRRRLLFRVVLPAALPTITTGMRVGLGFSWMCVIVSEMLAVKSGLGYVLWDSYYFSNLDMVVAAMASIGLLGFASDKIFRALTRPYLRWADQGDRT
jgi:NitT/TauT family transport system permease protein